MRPSLLRVTLVLAVAFAIGSPVVQSLSGWGLSASEFADDGNETLRAAGYAFSIWGVIYAGLAAFALYAFLPIGRGSAATTGAGLPAVIAIASCGAWIWASAGDQKWQTVAWIVLGAATAVTALLAARRAGPLSRWDRVFVLWPLALLAGWLTIASAVNILTVLTAVGLIEARSATPAAIVGVLAVALAAFLVLRISRAPIYGLPVAWGLAAVFAAERTDNAPVAFTAAAAAGVVILFALSSMRSRPTVAPH
jgi:hypothetical protein